MLRKENSKGLLLNESDNVIKIRKSIINDCYQVLSTRIGSDTSTVIFSFTTKELAVEAGRKIAEAIGAYFYGLV